MLDDEPDNRIAERAVAAKAPVIVTGHKHPLASKSHEGVGVMTVSDPPRTFPQAP